MYSKAHAMMSLVGSYKADWSQQKPPYEAGKSVNGLRYVKVAPESVETAAYQFPVMRTTLPLFAALGSSIRLAKPDGIPLGEALRKPTRSVGDAAVLSLGIKRWGGIVGFSAGGAPLFPSSDADGPSTEALGLRLTWLSLNSRAFL
jgi:hypothetical protein